MSVMTLDKDVGIDLLSKAISVIEAEILSKGGKMEVKMAPKAVSIREETELQAMMDRLAAENEEVDGDEPEDDGEA
jgi:translation initiation factor 2 subunit 1